MSVRRLLLTLSTEEIHEWIAFDRTKDEEWMRNYKEESMTDEQRDAAILAAFSKGAK